MENINHDLKRTLIESFLPRVFFAVENTLAVLNAHVDVDGSIFVALLCFIARNVDEPLGSIVDSDICATVDTVWAEIKLPRPVFSKLSSYALSDAGPQSAPSPAKPMKLLPFSNPVFDKELSAVHVVVEEEDKDIDDGAVHGEDKDNNNADLTERFHFNKGTIFSDTQHWHNNRRAILPRHLGGEDTKYADERHRQRKLRSDQRFMANLQNQAGTLTGASGAALKQIKIPPVGSHAQRKPVMNVCQL
jgi:hypothetical protein